MSELGLSDVHVDQHLSQISIGFKPEGHIASVLAPIVPVQKQRDTYIIWGTENFKVPVTTRAPGSKSRTVNWTVNSTGFFCANHGLSHEEPLENIDNQDLQALNLRESNAENLVDNMMQAWEARVANIVTSTSNVGNSVTLSGSTTGQFNDFANSEPVLAIMAGIDAVRVGAKNPANTMVISYDVWSTLRQHPQIQNLIFPHGGGIPTVDQFAAVFFGDASRGRVLIADAMQNTAEENQSEAISDFWSGDILIAHIAPRPSKRAPSLLYTFRWTPSNFPSAMTVLRDVRNEAGSEHVEVIETMMFQDEKVTHANAGYLIKAAIA